MLAVALLRFLVLCTPLHWVFRWRWRGLVLLHGAKDTRLLLHSNRYVLFMLKKDSKRKRPLKTNVAPVAMVVRISEMCPIFSVCEQPTPPCFGRRRRISSPHSPEIEYLPIRCYLRRACRCRKAYKSGMPIYKEKGCFNEMLSKKYDPLGALKKLCRWVHTDCRTKHVPYVGSLDSLFVFSWHCAVAGCVSSSSGALVALVENGQDHQQADPSIFRMAMLFLPFFCCWLVGVARTGKGVCDLPPTTLEMALVGVSGHAHCSTLTISARVDSVVRNANDVDVSHVMINAVNQVHLTTHESPA